MALFVRQDDSRSQLQTRVAAELQEKIKRQSLETPPEEMEPVYLENQHTTHSLSVPTIVLTLMAIVVVVIIIIQPK